MRGEQRPDAAAAAIDALESLVPKLDPAEMQQIQADRERLVKGILAHERRLRTRASVLSCGKVITLAFILFRSALVTDCVFRLQSFASIVEALEAEERRKRTQQEEAARAAAAAAPQPTRHDRYNIGEAEFWQGRAEFGTDGMLLT